MASLEEIREERIKKLKTLASKGINPYPVSVKADAALKDVLKDFSKLSRRKKPIFLVGRVRAIREHGGSLFLDIDDGTGKIQVYLKKDILGEDNFNSIKENLDLGDFIECSGKLFLTKRNEKTLDTVGVRIISKSLRPLPDKWHGLKDVEERFRKRYLDILMNPEVKQRFILRSKIIKEFRNVLDEKDFVEVETPMLHPIAGGAIAKPFQTHHNALDIDLYLRIAPELYLKRLLVGGMPKVYEINRSFRNEGVDVTHNPEFTSLEGYNSYSTAEKEMALIEDMLVSITKAVLGKQKFSYDDKVVEIKKPFKIVTFSSLLKKCVLMSEKEMENRAEVAIKAKQFGIDVKDNDGIEKILDNIYKKKCRPNIIEPTYIIDFPAAFSPLAKRKEDKPWLVDRFQLVIGGVEIAQGFSELNNPIEQKERFEEQEKKKARGDEEAGECDDEYVEALEYGMPPAGGWGIGIDRVVMLFTDTKNIREVVIFPTLRPK